MLPTAFAAPLVHRTRPASQETRRLFPRFVGGSAIKIGALRLFGQTLDFSNREHLARFLRESGSDRFRLAWNQRVNFVSIKPDEMTVLADIDVDFCSVGQGDVDHRLPAQWARQA